MLRKIFITLAVSFLQVASAETTQCLNLQIGLNGLLENIKSQTLQTREGKLPTLDQIEENYKNAQQLYGSKYNEIFKRFERENCYACLQENDNLNKLNNEIKILKNLDHYNESKHVIKLVNSLERKKSNVIKRLNIECSN